MTIGEGGPLQGGLGLRIRRLFLPGGSLPQRAARGIVWAFGFHIFDSLLGLGKVVIVARFLSPSDFGLLGMAFLAVAILESVSQTGLQAALVQKREPAVRAYDAAWTAGLLRGAGIFLVLFFLAPSAAAFFGAPQAAPIIRAIAAYSLLQGLTNIGVVEFQREMEFRKRVLFQLCGSLAEFAVAVTWAVLARNVWALVAGNLAGYAARCLMSYVLSPYRPRITSRLAEARELFGFGRWILGSNLAMFLFTNLDDIFVGKFLGAKMLGFYQMAYRISNVPATEITRVISEVSFPAFSRLQDSPEKLKEASLKVLTLNAVVSAAATGAIVVLAGDFTRLFLGENWTPMIPAIQILAFWGFIRSVSASTGPLFLGLGRPDILTRIQVLQLGILVLGIYPMSMRWGIGGASAAVVGASVIPSLISWNKAVRLLPAPAGGFTRSLIFPAVIALAAGGIACLPALIPAATLSLFLRFLFKALLYSGTYGAAVWLLDARSEYKTVSILRDIWARHL